MEQLSFSEHFILQMVNWPFLLFVGLFVLVYNFRKPLENLISRGGITITWGEKSFTITELPEKLNVNFSTLADDIDDLKQSVAELRKMVPDSPKPPTSTPPSKETLIDAKNRMLPALEQGEYRWRSIERLASIGAITDEQAEDILRPLDEVIFGRGKSGRTIVRLKTR